VVLAQLVRAPLCGSGGRRFESGIPPQKNNMTEISYTVGKENGTIHWAAAEQFDEIKGKVFKLDEMEATQIEKLENLSITAKILLSAVAGAIIQHLIDKKVATELIFSGSFTVENKF
jgi:hypothetical protein